MFERPLPRHSLVPALNSSVISRPRPSLGECVFWLAAVKRRKACASLKCGSRGEKKMGSRGRRGGWSILPKRNFETRSTGDKSGPLSPFSLLARARETKRNETNSHPNTVGWRFVEKPRAVLFHEHTRPRLLLALQGEKSSQGRDIGRTRSGDNVEAVGTSGGGWWTD